GPALEAESRGARKGGHVQEKPARKIGMLLMDKTRLGQNVQIGVRGQAIGPQGHRGSVHYEVTKAMGRVAKGGMSSRAIDQVAGKLGRGREVVAMNEQGTAKTTIIQDSFDVRHQACPIPHSQFRKEF